MLTRRERGGLAGRGPGDPRLGGRVGDGRRRAATTPAAWSWSPPCSAWARPAWDFGARGAVLGLDPRNGPGAAGAGRARRRGPPRRRPARSGRGRHRTSDRRVLRVDGGMSANRVFVQALANACGRPVEVSPELEATTLGAGFLAGMAVGSVDRRGRRGRDLAAPGPWSSPSGHLRPGPVARKRSSGPGAGTPSCRAISF